MKGRKALAPSTLNMLPKLELAPFLRLMASAPFERHTETIMGSISGVRPTATATAKKKAPFQSCFCEPVDEEDKGNHHGNEPEGTIQAATVHG